MFDDVDGYCERLAPGFWGEPLNAVTNLAFLAGALVIARTAQREGTLGNASLAVPLSLLALTGIGSFLFHTFANGWTGIADTLALGLCLLATIYASARRFLGQSWYLALIWPVGMLSAAFAFGAYLPVPGSFYFGPLATGGIIALVLLRNGHPAGRWIGAAILVFLPSFVFRSLDDPLCGSWPYGTHFLWHILNGVVLGLAIRPLAWTHRGEKTHGTGRTAG
jgi:hypothetical protein